MPNVEGVADHAAPKQVTVGWSPKAVWTTVTAVVLPFLLAGAAEVVETLANNPQLFDGLPGPVQFAISVVVTGLGVLLAGRKAGPGKVVYEDELDS